MVANQTNPTPNSADDVLSATAAILSVMMGKPIDWETADDDLLQSADWATCREYAEAALSSRQPDLVEVLSDAMRTAWDDICSDTGYHPVDIQHGRGKQLTFEPNHWVRAIAMHLRATDQTVPDAGLVGELRAAIDAWHDCAPQGQGEGWSDDADEKRNAMCQLFYDNSDRILTALSRNAGLLELAAPFVRDFPTSSSAAEKQKSELLAIINAQLGDGK